MGAALFASEGRHVATGAAFGSSAAVAGGLRRGAPSRARGRKIGLPDPVVALAEDAVVLLGSLHLLKDRPLT